MAASYSTNPKSTYTKIATQTSTSTVSSITFSNIPQNFTDLILVVNGKGTNGTQGLGFYFNGDTGTNYSRTIVYGNGTNALSTRDSSVALSAIGVIDDTTISDSIYHFMNYSNGSTYKTALGRGNCAAQQLRAGVGLWRNVAPVTSISIMLQSGSIVSGTTFTLYGIECAKAPKADGGTIYTDGTYWYHAFRTSGLFVPKQSITADVLVVAGGGGGGSGLTGTNNQAGGGGGAGGVIAFASQALVGTGYPVTVGAGGGGGFANTVGSQGSDSIFGSLTTAVGGGYGALCSLSNTNRTGGTGGSGGGGSGQGANTGTGGSNTSGQGNVGGGTTSGTWEASGGGGGAGGVGTAGTQGSTSPASVGGNGGAGTNTVTNWGALSAALSATGLGVSGFIAGGGAGTTYYGTVGSAGSGGGGTANKTTAGGSGTTNTGSGGGGTGNGGGGAGGSGLVIVRYAV